jgi:WD40 repeat protein
VNSVVDSKNGKYIAYGSDDSTVKLWNAEIGMLEKTFVGHKSEVTSIEFSPEEINIVSGSYDKRIIIWNSKTGEEEKVLIGHNHYVTFV